MLSLSRIRDRCASELRAWVGAPALHSPHSFDALRNRCERRIGYALAAQNLCRPDQTSGNAMTEPATLDPLSAIAPLFRARPEIQDVCRFALQWEVVHEAEPAGFAQFHIVTNGNCLLEQYCGETFKLEAGSILLLPQGDSHVVRSASRGGSSGAPIRTEYNNAGAATIATELATALFVMMLRLHFEQSASSSGRIRLLASSSSARAVTAMLRAPAHPWTLDELAAEAHVSRATLVRIFRREGDLPPLGFLSELRLGLARQRLRRMKPWRRWRQPS